MENNENIGKTRESVSNARKTAEEILKELKSQQTGFDLEEIFGEKQSKINDIENNLRDIDYLYDRLVELGGSVSDKGYFKAIDRFSDCTAVLMPEGLHVAGNMYVSQNELNPPIIIPCGFASEFVSEFVGKLYGYYYEELKEAVIKLVESCN